MKFFLAVGVVFCCWFFFTQERSSIKLDDENQPEISKVCVNSTPFECLVQTTCVKDDFPSKGFVFYDPGDKFLSVFVQVDLPENGKTYYLRGGAMNIKGNKKEKATRFQAEAVLSSTTFRVKVPIENVHAELIIDQMKNWAVGLGSESGNTSPETGNQTPDKVGLQDGLQLRFKFELGTLKEK